MTDWSDEVEARLLHDDFGGGDTPPTRQRQRWLDVRAALGEIGRLTADRDNWKQCAHVEAKGLRCAFKERARAAEAEVARMTKVWNEEMENTAAWKVRAESAEAEVERLRVDADHEQGLRWLAQMSASEAYAKRDCLLSDLSVMKARAERAEAEVERLTNKLNADSQNFEIECLSSEVERLKHLIFVWRQASYSGTPDEYQRAAVDLEDEALRIGVTRAGPKHSKHPTGDYCVYCLSQWPCEESGGE